MLSDKDTIGRSLKKMTDGLSSMIKAIEQRDYLLHAVNRTADILLRADEHNFDDSLEEGMALIADCVGVDSIHIWKAERMKGVLTYYLDCKYINSSIQPTIIRSEPLGFQYPYSTGLDKDVSGRKCINGPVAGFSHEVRDSLTPHNIKSILIMPLFVRDSFWGQVSFEDCREERVFNESEVSILHSASLMIANARNRQEEAALIREADQRTKLMLEATPLCTQLWNKNMGLVDCNEAAVKLFGVRDKQEFFNRFFELSPEYQPDGRRSEEVVFEILRRALDGEHIVVDGWMHQKLDGTPIPAEVVATRVKYGNEYVVAAYASDKREYNRMMKKIESLLLETQAVNQAKSEFMARMSHEMLTPMNVIMGMTQVAQMSDDILGSLKECFDEIGDASNHLLRLIKDVLEMSNMTFDILKLDNSAFSFTDVFDDALKVVGRFMQAKQQNFIFDLDRSIPPLLIGDKRRLGQVIVKILENAAKFTPERGEIRFAARALNQDDEMVTLKVEITDNGLGIAEERQKSLFNVFEQIDGGLTREHGGLGLGLALSKRIIEMMGGNIWVDSELGKGSKFTFTCRVKKQNASLAA
jgi:signal transduction histidine kinase